MKLKKCMGICLVLFSLFLPGCKKEEEIPVAPVQDAWTVIQPDNAIAYTLDEEGNIVTFEFVEDDGVFDFFLRKYDLTGSRVFSKKIENEFASAVNTMTVKDGLVYFAPSVVEDNKVQVVLHSYNMETDEMVRVAAFPFCEEAKRILVGENRIYLLGTEGHARYVNSTEYAYGGELIMYYSKAGDEVFRLAVEEPIDIAFDDEEQLVLYVHTEDGFCMMQYDETRDAIRTIAKTEEYKLHNFTLGEGDSVIYQTSSRGLVVSSLDDLDVECELYPNGFFWDNDLCYVNGRVACRAFNREIIRFVLEDVKKDNQTIRYISTGYEPEEPYGCGYEMQRTELEKDKFALKILSLDQDYDLCMVNTSTSISDNLKKNGVFYPLNEVSGVQQYFDACYPYVREAATDEDGNIWMLPISVDMPGVVAGKEGQEKGLLREGILYEEYFDAHSLLTKEERTRVSMPWSMMLDFFFMQYFSENTTTDTKEFRNVMSVLAEHSDLLMNSASANSGERFYEYVRYESQYSSQHVLEFSEAPLAYELPKYTEGAESVGSCVFLAVNPQSEHLDATLAYISSWIAYKLESGEVPLFFQNQKAPETAYEASVQKLFQNGKIGYMIDRSVVTGWEEVLKDVTKLEQYVKETDRKLQMYLKE